MTPDDAARTARMLSRRHRAARDAYLSWVDIKEQAAQDKDTMGHDAYTEAPDGTADQRKRYVDAQVAKHKAGHAKAEDMTRLELEEIRTVRQQMSLLQSILAKQRSEDEALKGGQDWTFPLDDNEPLPDRPDE